MGTAGEQARHLRISELSGRVGVSAELLRAWERRYGLLNPRRTPAGYRLYGSGDIRRVARMRAHLAAGVAAAEAAQLTLAEFAADPAGGQEPQTEMGSIEALHRALEGFQEGAAHAAFDRLLASHSLETVLAEAVLPYLGGIGDRWEQGEAVIGREHFATALLRGRLLGLARGWGEGSGPRALLACAPDEQHDLGLICFGLALRRYGWRITFLGADTPLQTALQTARTLQPAVIVMSASVPEHLTAHAAELSELAAAVALELAGAGASHEIAERVGAAYLAEDTLDAAASVALRAAS